MADNIPRWRGALYAALVVAIFFGVAELVFRVHDFKFYYNLSADVLGMPVFDMSRFRRIANNTVEFDPEVFWKFKPNQVLNAEGVYLKPVRINNFGFRGADFPKDKPAGTFRVICLGDSATFGWSVGDEETYPSQLELALQKAHPGCKVEVLNLGVTGYTSFQGRQLFKKWGPLLKPDLVLASFGVNDRYPALRSDEEHHQAGTWKVGRLNLLLRHSEVYKLVKAGVVYAERRRSGLSLNQKTFLPQLKRKVSEDEYSANLKAINDECQNIGCQVIILNDDFPSLAQDPSLDLLRAVAEKHGGSLSPAWKPWNEIDLNNKISGETGAPLLDLRSLLAENIPQVLAGSENPDLKKEPWRMLMVDPGHPNAHGNKIIADRLAEMIDSQPAFSQFRSKCEKEN